MNKADGPEPKWWSEFEGIVYPQWAPALVWRALMRWLPSVFPTGSQQELQPEVMESAAGALKLLMSYPFVLDLAYRSQRTKIPADSREVTVAQQFQKLAPRIEGMKSLLADRVDPARRQLLERMAVMLQEGANAPPRLAQTAMEALVIVVPHSMRSGWDKSVEIDLGALYPLTEEKIDDLQKFLSSTLWPRSLYNDSPGGLGPQFSDGRPANSETFALHDVLMAHMARPLEWNKLLDLLTSRPDGQTLTPDQAVQIEAIAADPARLATLLARMALNDRTRLDLAAAPSVAGFREALDKRGLRRAELPVLEQRLASEQKGFVPNPTWVAWVQTVHRPGLENILAELKSWLPSAKAMPDIEHIKPSSAKRPSMKKS